MNRKYNRVREFRLKSSKSSKENNPFGKFFKILFSKGGNITERKVKEELDENIQVMSVSNNKGFNRIKNTPSRVLGNITNMKRKKTFYKSNTLETENKSKIMNLAQLDNFKIQEFDYEDSHQLRTQRANYSEKYPKYLTKRPDKVETDREDKENKFLWIQENTNELSSTLMNDVSPSPYKNMIKNFKPTKNISQVVDS